MELYHFGTVVQRGKPAEGLLDSLYWKSLRAKQVFCDGAIARTTSKWSVKRL
jgi:hypothetical protein